MVSFHRVAILRIDIAPTHQRHLRNQRFTLGNTNDAIIILNPLSEIVDQVAYDVSVEPWKTFNKAGYSLQLDPAYYSAADNDNANYWCNAAEPTLGGDFGTPGGANTDCSLI